MQTRALVILAILAVLGASASQAAWSHPLETAVYEPSLSAGDVGRALNRVRSSGATAVRLVVRWDSIAVSAAGPPVDATDPASASYRWGSLDKQVVGANARGLEPIISILGAPAWATVAPVSGAERTLPAPAELGKFTLAAARRYNGSFENLPRVRYWQVWNEPNISLFFRPQFVGRKPFSPGWYRRMVNEVAAAVKSVRADNLVIAGGTAPFRDIHAEVQKIDPRWGPLSFMRELLCLSRSLKPKCRERIRFDVWAHNPYTSGGPTHEAVLPDDVSLGDLPEMKKVLDAGARSGNIVSRGSVRFWVTEFSWDSNRPDPEGVPTRLHTRWVAEALYRMWQSGVSLVTWFLLRDQPLATSFFQSGLYYRGATPARDRPKPALQAFRFPVVAVPDARGVLVWGRTPSSRTGRVVVERSVPGGWKRLALIRPTGTGSSSAGSPSLTPASFEPGWRRPERGRFRSASSSCPIASSIRSARRRTSSRNVPSGGVRGVSGGGGRPRPQRRLARSGARMRFASRRAEACAPSRSRP